ncbi:MULTISPECIES: hypothetical protein [Clostridium]|uniref:hypothetical protein n=1 Tax=Clostridium TaxID=1485 RepID=UPI00090A1F76|nr:MULTISPECIES: hypothetical protein [Clostridium]APF25264.1 hypothetical protein NPD7_3836 [Clostridium sporogenes]MBD5639492.1 hypothetical protein [Clostridium botulinum]MDI6918962.1 hypothetical protein [Clostridium botulinum]OPD20391.1 hypothetical protein AL710_11900 [Clostridium botulinum]WMU99820.1 hypothetical protein QA656_19495 [Clostridium botulinum]
MKRITIDIFERQDKELNGLINIDSKELCINYANTPTMHGLQCNFDGDAKEYLEVQNVLDEIADLVRKLNKIYK